MTLQSRQLLVCCCVRSSKLLTIRGREWFRACCGRRLWGGRSCWRRCRRRAWRSREGCPSSSRAGSSRGRTWWAWWVMIWINSFFSWDFPCESTNLQICFNLCPRLRDLLLPHPGRELGGVLQTRLLVRALADRRAEAAEMRNGKNWEISQIILKGNIQWRNGILRSVDL